MAPELQIITLTCVCIGMGYGFIYPSFRPVTMSKVMWADTAISALLFGVVAALFYGTGTAFSIVIATVPWWAFTILILAIIEIPAFFWFSARHGLKISDLDPKD